MSIMVEEESDQQILDSIDEVILRRDYEELDSFESLNYILEKVDTQLELEFILKEKKRLEKQLLVVTKKLSSSIVEKEGAYSEELGRVMEIQQKLSDTYQICRGARDGFEKSRKNFTWASLGIVASYRRREGLRDVLNLLSTIKTLQQTNERIREMIEEDNDYCNAIQLCIECQKVVNTLRHYKCISELSSKVQELLELVEEHVDASLSKMCHYFNYETYASLQKAYRLLGKTQASMDSLCMHFATAIADKAFSVVHGYVELCCSPEIKKSENLRKKEYRELCKFVANECFVPCLNDFCKSLFNILLNYKRILRYHHHHAEYESSDEVQLDEVEEQFNQRFVQQKLEHGLGRVWQETQTKLRLLVQCHDISSCSFEELMAILKITRRMMDIGLEFCENKSCELEEALHTKTVNYFKIYHKTRLDELEMYLENESWTICPVKSGFTYLELQEFKFLKPLLVNNSYFVTISNNDESTVSSTAAFFAEALLKEVNESIEGAFDNIFQENEDLSDSLLKEIEKSNKGNGNKDGNDTSEDEQDDEFDKDSVNNAESCAGHSYNDGPMVNNTCLYVLRLIGKYMQIMFLLKQIGFDILLSIFDLFDIYFYTIFEFFAKEISEIKNTYLTNRLKSCLMRIEASSKGSSSEPGPRFSFLNSILLQNQDSNRENLYGLTKRMVGIESLIFLAEQLEAFQDFFRELIPPSKHSILEQYYVQTVSVAKDIRTPAYMLVAARSVDYEAIISSMENVRWDIKEIPSIHNPYVEQLLQELRNFSTRLAQIFEQLQAKIFPEAKNTLWSSVLKLANRTFIEGFSMAKKCTPAGRALMQLDYQEFLSKAEKMAAIKPIPERELVEEYIKAYYLMDDALEQWMLTRNEYTYRQLASLVNSVSIEKKAKNRLLTLLESKFDSNLNSSLQNSK